MPHIGSATFTPSTTGTAVSTVMPAAAAAGHVAYYAVGTNSGTATCTTPSGWTLVEGPVRAGSALSGWLFSKVLTGGEAGTTITATLSASGRRHGIITVVSTSGTGFDTKTMWNDTSADTTLSVPTYTPGVANAQVFVLTLSRYGTTNGTVTYPAGYTEHAEAITGYAVPNFAVAVASETLTGGPSAQPAENGTYTQAASTIGWVLTFAPLSTTTPVSTTRSTTWDTETTTTATRGTTWSTAASTAATRSTTWTTASAALATRATTWATGALVTATRPTTWAVRAAVAAARGTTWQASSIVSAARSTTWATLASAVATRATSWTTAAVASVTRSTTWNVAGSLTSVVATRATSWAVRASVAATRLTTWATSSTTTSTRPTSWTTAATTTASRSTSWNVAGTLATVTASRVTSWAVAAQTTATRATSWATRSSTTATRSTSWATRTSTTATRSTTWSVRRAVSALRTATWNALASVLTTRTASWGVDSTGPGLTPTHVFRIAADPRTFAIARDPRTFRIPAEPRIFRIPADPRTLEDSMATFVKDPADRDAIAVPWSDRLAVGETLSAVTWTIAPLDNAAPSLVQPQSPSTAPTTDTATIWLEGGAVGGTYRVSCKVTTSQQRILERSFTLQVVDR